LALNHREERRLAAATKYLEARQQAGRDVASRRQLAAAEASLAGELREGRLVLDDGTEVSARAGARVRVREPRSERPDRDVARAKRHGYTGDDDTLRLVGQKIRVATRSLNRVEMDALLEHFDGEIAAAIDSDDPDDLPARTPTPTPTPTPTGWQKDGFFHVTREQLRDAGFTGRHGTDLAKAGMSETLRIID
jgi:hypothetical protein